MWHAVYRKIKFFIVSALLIGCNCALATDADLASLEKLYQKYPQKIEQLFSELDLTQAALVPIKEKVDQKKYAEACLLLDRYYRTNKNHKEFRFTSYPQPKSIPLSTQKLSEGIFTFQGVSYKQPRLSDGRINWNDLGPKKDVKWPRLLNRHLHFLALLEAWRIGKKDEYARTFNVQMFDWLESSIHSKGHAWRAMEVARRLVDAWPQIFYGFQTCDDFDPATRTLMLASIPRHARVCMTEHSSEGNHLNAEMVALASVAVYWSEFKDAQKWIAFATKKMDEELTQRVYPDGAQKELSHHYQIVVANHADRIAYLLGLAKHPEAARYRTAADQLWRYVELVKKPDGFGPLNNDSDLENSATALKIAAARRLVAGWKDQAAPLDVETGENQSVFFKWAGQVVLRDTKNTNWLFFDTGPVGSVHQHYDTLNIALQIGKQDMLVDTGRYIYRLDQWRRFFTSPRAHNMLMVGDVHEPEFPSRVARKPSSTLFITQPQAKLAWGTTRVKIGNDPLSPTAQCQRIVIELPPNQWLIVDTVETFSAQPISHPWHFHPDRDVEVDGLTVRTTNAPYFTLQPVSDLHWSLTPIRGQRDPFIQGWWSPNYNERLATTTALYQSRIIRPAATAWLLTQSPKRTYSASAKILKNHGGIFHVMVENNSKNTEVEIRHYPPTQRSVVIQREGKTLLSYAEKSNPL